MTNAFGDAAPSALGRLAPDRGTGHDIPMSLRSPLLMLCTALLCAGCIGYPDVGEVEGPEIRDLKTPRLVPLEVLTRSEPLEVSLDLQGPLDARAADLNARAAALGGGAGVDDGFAARAGETRDIPDTLDADALNARAEALRARADTLNEAVVSDAAPVPTAPDTREDSIALPAEDQGTTAADAPVDNDLAERVRRLQERAQGMNDTGGIDTDTRSRIEEGIVAPD